MKRTKFLIGMLAMALAFGMMGCTQDASGGGGWGGTPTSLAGTTWEANAGGEIQQLTFTYKELTVIQYGTPVITTTYTLTGNTITLGTTEVWTISGNTITVPTGMGFNVIFTRKS
jgi:uncharacterized lipoprotein YehR (DUF1307 family)